MIPIKALLLILCLFISDPASKETLSDLPDPETFIQKAQENLRSDLLLQSRYTFNLKQSKFERDDEGEPEVVEVNEYEIYPSLDREYTYRKHITKNGRPLDSEDLEKQDLEHRKKLKDLEKKLEKEGVDEETYRRRMEESEQRKEEKIVRELPRLYEIKIAGRETIEGRNAIRVEYTPRPDYKPENTETKILSKLAGRAWFCEQDYQLMKAEVEFVDNLSFGWGFLARLHKGTEISLRRRYINDEIWLPTEIRIKGTARVLLLKKIRIHTVREYYNYKKYSVTSSHSFTNPE